MSGARKDGDCEHGHADQVLAFAEKVAGEHGSACDTAVLVFQDHESETPPTIIGTYNTSSLGSMTMAMLMKTAEHEPDGCPQCDGFAAAAFVALGVFRAELTKQVAARQAAENRRRN